MKKKKVLMLVLLISLLLVIAFLIYKVNNKSIKLNEQNEQIKENSKKEIIEIKDDYFIGATNDIYYKLDSYIGKTIKMEGFLYVYDYHGETRYGVVRNSPGCCGNDGLAGLEIKYDKEYPPKDTWVEIVGTVESEEVEKDYNVPVISVETMEEKEVGQTFVSN